MRPSPLPATTPAPDRRRYGRAARRRPPRRSSPRSATRKRACTCVASSRIGSSTGRKNPSAPVNEDVRLAAELPRPPLDLRVQLELAHDFANLLPDVLERRHVRDAALLRRFPKSGIVVGAQVRLCHFQSRGEALSREALEREPTPHPRGQL